MAGINIGTHETKIWNIVQAIIGLAQGRLNSVGQVTLTPNATTTTVTKDVSRAAINVAQGAEVKLTPRTANAAAALATTYIAIGDVGQQTFTITHANNAQVDRTFGWVAHG